MTKIQDEGEARRWFEAGRTYQWMADEYLRKYNLEVSPSTFSQLRRRRGWDRRNTRDDDLIPWAVLPEHRWAYALQMLRAEARRRSGKEMSNLTSARLDVWKETLNDAGAVVHYEPNTEQGFFYIPKEDGDDDLIRRPRQKTTLRRASD